MSLGDVAAKLGFPVFPCLDNKRPAIDSGFKAASADPAKIVAMFSKPAAALIGMPTGRVSGLIAIDIDIRDGYTGKDWLDLNADALPPTRTHKTRSGGLHLIFRAPEGVEIRNSASRIAQGVDVRGEGGYIIIPPSPGYQMADQTEPADMPRWLIKACSRPEPEPAPPQPSKPVDIQATGGTPYGLKALSGECASITAAVDGQKHYALNKAAYSVGGLVSAGALLEHEAKRALMDSLEAIRARCADYEAAKRTLETAFQDGKDKARSIPDRRPTASSEPPPNFHLDDAYYDSLEADDLAGFEPDLTPDVDPAQNEPPKQGSNHGGAKAPPSPLPLIYYLNILPKLDVLDFVEGLLCSGSSAVIYGESNSGKTFFATDLALHVAAGIEWRGRAVEQGGVVYAALEGSAGFNNRITAWREKFCDQNIPFAAIPVTLNLLHPDADTPRLIDAAKAAETEFGQPVKLIVIDTLARAMAGGNENASEDMGALVGNMDKIREATGAAVLFIHHSGKDQAKGARGHSSLRAAIETEIEVTVQEGSTIRTARVVKQRELPTEGVFQFELKVIELGENRRGKQVTTCVVCPVESEQLQSVKRPAGHARTLLEMLVRAIDEGGKPNHQSEGRLCIPEKWLRDAFYDGAMPGADQDTKQKAFRRAVDSLLQTKQIGFNRGYLWANQ